MSGQVQQEQQTPESAVVDGWGSQVVLQQAVMGTLEHQKHGSALKEDCTWC